MRQFPPRPPGGAVGEGGWALEPRLRHPGPSLCTHSAGAFPASCVPPLPEHQALPLQVAVPLRAPGLQTPPGSDMGVPLVPEASGPRCGPVLLALFLAASRGKVGRSPTGALGRSTGTTRLGRGAQGERDAPLCLPCLLLAGTDLQGPAAVCQVPWLGGGTSACSDSCSRGCLPTLLCTESPEQD